MTSTKITDLKDYFLQRERLLHEAQVLKYGDLIFTEEERKANTIFKDLVNKVNSQIDEDFHLNPLQYRSVVENSQLYKALYDMPKGVQQHSHNPCSLPSRWFTKLSTADDVYIDDTNKLGRFDKNPGGNWKLVKDLRDKAADKDAFDKAFDDNFHLTLEDFDHLETWPRFEFKIGNRQTIALKDGVWEQCMLDTLLYAIEEGYSCLQIRMLLNFFEDPNFPDPAKEVEMYRRVLAKAQEKDPNFTLGVIFAGLRFWDNDKIAKFLDFTFELTKTNRDIVIGFDLVAEENLRAAIDFAPVFVKHMKRCQDEGVDCPLILHGGESLDYGNTNLFDLLLCNVPRMGHAFNLFKHSYLMPFVRERGICVEVNPISNLFLKYSIDLRAHPAVGYHNFGVKVSINSDDIEVFNLHTIWDFFVAAISFQFDLLDLKKTILNSIETSCLQKNIQDNLLNDWNSKWDSFVQNLLKN